MSDKESSGNESSGDTECPTCGRDDFATPEGMFYHSSVIHNEPLDEQRFWHKVDEGDGEECWLWQATVASDGYGNFWRDEKLLRAHRVAYELVNEHPGDSLVLHHCDTPLCVNPNHLYTGTHKDNAQDRTERGRANYPHGELAGAAKLTREEVDEIRRRYVEEDVSQRELAEEFDVGQSHTGRIIRGERWAHTFDE